MDFKVNEFTTIKYFKKLGIFQEIMKWGSSFTYEKFTGEMEDGTKVEGFICLADDNIYGLKPLEVTK